MIFIMSCCIQHLIGTCILGYRYLWQSVWLLFLYSTSIHTWKTLKWLKVVWVLFVFCLATTYTTLHEQMLGIACKDLEPLHFRPTVTITEMCILKLNVFLMWKLHYMSAYEIISGYFFFYFSWFEGMQNSLAISKDFKIVDLFLFLSKITETLCLFCIFRNYILYELENALLCPMTNKRPGNMFTDFLFSCFFTGKDVLCYAVW